MNNLTSTIHQVPLYNSSFGNLRQPQIDSIEKVIDALDNNLGQLDQLQTDDLVEMAKTLSSATN